jgi:hypothetical protein
VFSFYAYPIVFINEDEKLPRALKLLREMKSSIGIY